MNDLPDFCPCPFREYCRANGRCWKGYLKDYGKEAG